MKSETKSFEFKSVQSGAFIFFFSSKKNIGKEIRSLLKEDSNLEVFVRSKLPTIATCYPEKKKQFPFVDSPDNTKTFESSIGREDPDFTFFLFGSLHTLFYFSCHTRDPDVLMQEILCFEDPVIWRAPPIEWRVCSIINGVRTESGRGPYIYIHIYRVSVH